MKNPPTERSNSPFLRFASGGYWQHYFWPAALVLATCGAVLACHGESSSSRETASSSTASLPKLVLRDDTPDLMLTWVDPTGDFQVTEAIAQVPADARERVRVVVTTKTEGTQDPIYVADLRQKSPDGSYPVTVLARSAWEEIGAARRKARIEALAPVASQLAPQTSPTTQQESLVAVIYGAKWCGACREAERYLKRRGISVLEKDVDQSPQVQAELRAKLTKAQLPPTSSIPVIDIGGKLLVGFSQAAVDAALKAYGK